MWISLLSGKIPKGFTPDLSIISLLKKDIAKAWVVVTRSASQRVIDYAFKYARDNDRKKSNVCHKANILKYTKVVFWMLPEKPPPVIPIFSLMKKSLTAACMHMVMNPQQLMSSSALICLVIFLSDLTARSGRRIGLDSAQISAMMQHCLKPCMAVRRILPEKIWLIHSSYHGGVMMLNHIGETEAAERVKKCQ